MTLHLGITRISHRALVRIALLNCCQRPYVSIVVLGELLPVHFLIFDFDSPDSEADAQRGALFHEASHLTDDFLEHQLDAGRISAANVADRRVVQPLGVVQQAHYFRRLFGPFLRQKNIVFIPDLQSVRFHEPLVNYKDDLVALLDFFECVMGQTTFLGIPDTGYEEAEPRELNRQILDMAVLADGLGGAGPNLVDQLEIAFLLRFFLVLNLVGRGRLSDARDVEVCKRYRHRLLDNLPEDCNFCDRCHFLLNKITGEFISKIKIIINIIFYCN